MKRMYFAIAALTAVLTVAQPSTTITAPASGTFLLADDGGPLPPPDPPDFPPDK